MILHALEYGVSILARPEGRALLPKVQGTAKPTKFQSSPAPKDGRYTRRRRLVSSGHCFNPRPPRRTGATNAGAAVQYQTVVSILARPEGRALPAPREQGLGEQNVSILARPEGRALREHLDDIILIFHVSILARPEGRALPIFFKIDLERKSFQSSPAPKDGRYNGRSIFESRGMTFQSSPAPKDGRYDGSESRRPIRQRFQSSPAPKDGRYPAAVPCGRPVHGFNPRPPRRTGATVSPGAGAICNGVSILARPEGRALLHSAGIAAAAPWFQSSPAPKDGRYSGWYYTGTSRSCFNPRPPRRTGATICLIAHRDSIICFNPRPPRRTGATICLIAHRDSIICFNPRPPRRTGATSWNSTASCSRPRFNPRPPRRTGATHARAAVKC